MTPEQDNVLRDFSHTLLDRIALALSDLESLCRVCKIPPNEYQRAFAGILLFTTMDLMHKGLPKLTPREFGDVAEHQFTFFTELEKQDRANDH